MLHSSRDMGKEVNQRAGGWALLRSEHGETGKQAPSLLFFEHYKEPKYSKLVTAGNFLMRMNFPLWFWKDLSLCQERYRKGIQMIKLQLCRLCYIPHLKTWKQPACKGFSLQDRARPPALGWGESPRGREFSWLFCLPEQAGWVGEMQGGDVSKHLHHHAPLIPAVIEWHQQHEKPGCAGPFVFLSRDRSQLPPISCRNPEL